MSPRRRTPRAAGKRALLAGAAIAFLWAAQAYAQTPAAPAPSADGLQKDEMYMEADEVVREDDAGLTTANGNIEVRYNGRTLRADKLVYNDKTGVIHAYGHIVVVNADGSSEYADEMVLDEDMRAGVALGFVMFFFNQFAGALAKADIIPLFAAAWAPAVVALLAGVTLLCYTEDG